MSFLKIGTGIFWSITYLLIIKRGFNDKTYGMPMIALCANITWEFIFSFILPHQMPQLVVNIIWFALDTVIFFQFVKFGKNESPKWFLPTLVVTLTLNFLIVLAITLEFKDWFGKYSAFSQSLLMSILFIALLNKRNNVTGQSMYIAIFKMLGTLIASTLFLIFYPSLLIILLSIATFIFDWLYIGLLYVKFLEMGVNPWTRKSSTTFRKLPAFLRN